MTNQLNAEKSVVEKVSPTATKPTQAFDDKSLLRQSLDMFAWLFGPGEEDEMPDDDDGEGDGDGDGDDDGDGDGDDDRAAAPFSYRIVALLKDEREFVFYISDVNEANEFVRNLNLCELVKHAAFLPSPNWVSGVETKVHIDISPELLKKRKDQKDGKTAVLPR